MKKIEMKIFIQGVVLLTVLCLCAGYLASSSRAGILFQEKQERKGAESISPEQLAQAKAMFNERCARCHGEDGRGETASGNVLDVPNFTDEKFWKEEKGDERFITSITNGKDGMPAFGKKLSKQEISALLAYVRRFPKAVH
jgi:mono/diheme cytochrome c family protein